MGAEGLPAGSSTHPGLPADSQRRLPEVGWESAWGLGSPGVWVEGGCWIRGSLGSGCLPPPACISCKPLLGSSVSHVSHGLEPLPPSLPVLGFMRDLLPVHLLSPPTVCPSVSCHLCFWSVSFSASDLPLSSLPPMASLLLPPPLLLYVHEPWLTRALILSLFPSCSRIKR